MGMIIQNGKIFSGDVVLKDVIIDTLWSGTGSTVSGTVTLSNSYTDYDLLIFKCYNVNGGMYSSSTWETKTLNLSNPIMVSNLSIDRTIRRTIIAFTNSTTITLKNLDGDNYLKEVIGIKLNGGVSSNYHEYSTNERIVGKWVDGRPVYEKTLNVGTIGSGTTFAHGITNLDWIIDYSAFGLYAGESKLVSPANGSSSSIGFVISTWDSTNITFTKGNLSYNLSDCYCTIRYIKTNT